MYEHLIKVASIKTFSAHLYYYRFISTNFLFSDVFRNFLFPEFDIMDGAYFSQVTVGLQL